MRKNTFSKNIISISLLLFFATSMFIGVLYSQNRVNMLTNSISQNKAQDSGGNTMGSLAEVESWWNTSWRFRVQINITESGYASRTNEPVDVWLNFTDLSETGVSSCGNDSIRVLEYSAPTWTVLNSQVWNETYDGTGNISTATITFQVDINKGETKSYYIYYNETGVPIIYSSDLLMYPDYAQNAAYIANGIFDLGLKLSDGLFNLTYTAGTVQNYHYNQSLSPLGPTYNYHYGTEYFYAYSTEWIEICAFENDTVVKVYDSTGTEIASNYLNQYDIWKYPSSGTLGAGLYRVVSNNPVSIIVTSCTPSSGNSDDEVWAAYDTNILGRIQKHLWITAFEDGTHITVYDANNSLTVLDTTLNNRGHILYNTSSAVNLFEVYYINASHPVSVVAGLANDGMFTGIYGKDQKTFVFPSFRTFGMVSEEGNNQISWDNGKGNVGTRTLGEGEFYEIDSGNNAYITAWVKLNATKPLRIFARNYGNTGTAVASENPVGTLFYVNDPGGGTIRMTAIADNTQIIYNQSSPSGTYKIINLNKGGTYTQSIAGAGAKITSDKPIFVQYWDDGNPQSTSMYIPQKTIPPKVSSMQLIENGSVFIKIKLTWQSIGGMNTTDYLTVYNDYELFKLERQVWLWNAQNNPSFRILDSYIRGSHFDEYVYDDTTYGTTLNDTNFNAQNYTVVHDRDSDLMSVGIFLSGAEGNGTVNVTSVTWSTDYIYFYDEVHLIPGYQTSMETPSNPTVNDFAKFTFWEYIADGVNANPDIYETDDKLFNPLQVSAVGNETSRFFNLVINLKDIDGLPAANCKVFINKTDASTQLVNYTQYSDSLGVATFSRLEDGNYSVNVTFTEPDFGTEILLNYTSKIVLDNDYSLTIENLQLSHLDLSFISYPDGLDLDGAIIHFWNMTGSSYVYLGNKSANGGSVSLYWTNTSGAVWNYTINVTFYGSPQSNIRLNKSGALWSDKLNFSMPFYTAEIIEVSLEDFSTQLLNYTPKTFTLDYGQNLTFSIRYNYSVGATIDQGITGASFDLQLSYESIIVDTSTLQFQAVTGQPGNYSLEFNSSEFGLLAEKQYIFLVEASKPGFEPKGLVFTFTLNAITTSLTVTLNSSVYWGQNLTIIAQYNDSNSNPINDSWVRFTWGTASGNLTWDATNGYYITHVNTSITFHGYQIVDLSASKQNYESKLNQPFAFNLLERQTKLNNSDEIFKEIIIYANDAVNITFYYVDVLSGQNITGAQALYSYNGTLYNMDALPTGIYVLDFNTELRAVGKYVIGVNIKKDNYSQPQMILFLNILQRPVAITVMPPVIALPQRSSSMLIVTLVDSASNTPLTNISVTYTLDGIPFGELTPNANGQLMVPIDTSTLPIGAHYIIISMNHENYTMPVYTVSLTVSYAQIFGIDEPIFYTIVIAAAVAIAAISIYVAVRSARIPYVVKKIDETIKAINKGKDQINAPVMKSKEAIYSEMFGSDWAVLDMEPPIKPKKAAVESLEQFKDLLISMKSIKMTDKEIENLHLKLSKLPKEECLKLLESMGIPPDASERLIKIAKK
ncbi:MAG: hypothetical protein ACTSRG_13850 [Candidatus Helarchaeota archaeon]